MSASITALMSGRCTLTATTSPVMVIALCTWERDAAAAGRSSIERKASLTGRPSWLSITPLATAKGIGAALSCSLLSSLMKDAGSNIRPGRTAVVRVSRRWGRALRTRGAGAPAQRGVRAAAPRVSASTRKDLAGRPSPCREGRRTRSRTKTDRDLAVALQVPIRFDDLKHGHACFLLLPFSFTIGLIGLIRPMRERERGEGRKGEGREGQDRGTTAPRGRWTSEEERGEGRPPA